MERIYTILVDSGLRSPARQQFAKATYGSPIDLASRRMSDPPRPLLSIERLSAQELQELAQEPEFVAAAEVMQTKLLAPAVPANPETPTGAPGAADDWGIVAIGADRSPYSGKGVTAGMLDTGIDAQHAAFRGVNLVEKDFTGSGNGDFDGSGTHAAGIFFGQDVNGTRIGVASGISRALIAKVIAPGVGNSDMLLRGLCWAYENGARVISMAVGLDFQGTVDNRVAQGWPEDLATTVALEAFCENRKLFEHLLNMLRMQEALTGGALIFSPAGNESRRGKGGYFALATCMQSLADKVISVASFDPDPAGAGFQISSFSNCGVTVSAPGRDIVSACAGGLLKSLSGTGAACPYAAGIAALWWEAVAQGGLPANATVVRDKLIASAQSRGFSPGISAAERGAGRVLAPTARSVTFTSNSLSRNAHLMNASAGSVWAGRQGAQH